jgi:hypothetical protein
VPGQVVSLKSSDGDTIERLPDPEWEIFQQLQKRSSSWSSRSDSGAELGQAHNGLPSLSSSMLIEP